MVPTPSVLMDDVAVFRRFNRMYTQFLGTLNESLLDSPYSLAEARVLYELATRDAPKAREIAEELGIDAGYLSRLLGKFERDGLLTRKASESDRRSDDLSLTARGRTAFKKLNARSEEQAQSVLQGLLPSVRMQFIDCMRTMEGILTKTDRRRLPYILRPHRVGDMGWIVHREGIGYAEQYGWDETFEALVARIVDQFITNFDPSRERCWIAEIDGAHVGHIFLVKHPEESDTAKLRLLFVEPSARGMGLGNALVNECIRLRGRRGIRKWFFGRRASLLGHIGFMKEPGFGW